MRQYGHRDQFSAPACQCPFSVQRKGSDCQAPLHIICVIDPASERAWLARHPSFVPRQGSRTMTRELEALISKMHKGGILYAEAVREFRKAFIATVLRENNGNQSQAARELSMHRITLSRTVSVLELDLRAICAGSRRPPGREPFLSAITNKKMSR